ncbi:phosphotransferase [Nocardiopsis akebiae]|uniref:phosphotransferase n=1 Tax=Nocardiopsis akebiae TaxID=2831968 RepID=UPI003742B86C
MRAGLPWLPVLAPRLTLPVPVPLLGVPSPRFERPWTVTTWLPGTPADPAPATNAEGAAEDLAAFLTGDGAVRRFYRAYRPTPAPREPAPGPAKAHHRGAPRVIAAWAQAWRRRRRSAPRAPGGGALSGRERRVGVCAGRVPGPAHTPVRDQPL